MTQSFSYWCCHSYHDVNICEIEEPVDDDVRFLSIPSRKTTCRQVYYPFTMLSLSGWTIWNMKSNVMTKWHLNIMGCLFNGRWSKQPKPPEAYVSAGWLWEFDALTMC